VIIYMGSVVEGINLLPVTYFSFNWSYIYIYIYIYIILLLLVSFWRYPILQFWLFSTRDKLQICWN
jgi:hypothetical protein